MGIGSKKRLETDLLFCFFYFSAYKEHCLTYIAQFNMVNLISRSREDNSFILKQEFQKNQNLLESAIILFSQQEDLLKEELFNHIKCYMSQKFYNPERPFKTLVEEAEHVLYFFNNYIISTIDSIQKEFGNFALQIWCPAFVEVLTEIIWPSIKTLAHDGKDKSMNFHELTFQCSSE